MKYLSYQNRIIKRMKRTLPGAIAIGFLTFPGMLLPERIKGESPLLKDLSIPQIEFKEPQVSREKLPSGAILLKAKDSSLPFITLEFYFTGGLNAEDLTRAGSLEALTSLLSIDGAGSKTGEQIASELNSMGAKLEIKAEYETWNVSLTVLNRNFDRAFEVFSDILSSPALSKERLATVQSQMLADIKQRNDDPSKIASRKLKEYMFPGTRFSHSNQEKEVKALTAENLRSDLERRLNPETLKIAVSGDYEELGVDAKLNALLEKFPRSAEKLKIEKITPNVKNQPEILLVDTPAQQAVIFAGTYLPPHSSPDFYALQTGNYILGGGSFNSRLMREIRTIRGLAYYAYSRNVFQNDTGYFVQGAGTRLDRVPETLNLMLDITGGMKNSVRSEELTLAKDSILNSLVFQFNNPKDVLINEIRFMNHRMPENYLVEFPAKIRAIDSADISRTFKTHIKTDGMYIVIAGPANLKSALEKIRPVRVVKPDDDMPQGAGQN